MCWFGEDLTAPCGKAVLQEAGCSLETLDPKVHIYESLLQRHPQYFQTEHLEIYWKVFLFSSIVKLENCVTKRKLVSF